jgi:hypothetical protein
LATWTRRAESFERRKTVDHSTSESSAKRRHNSSPTWFSTSWGNDQRDNFNWCRSIIKYNVANWVRIFKKIKPVHHDRFSPVCLRSMDCKDASLGWMTSLSYWNKRTLLVCKPHS